MGSIRFLEDETKNVHLLITNSNLIEIYVHDTLKKFYEASVECIVDINGINSFKGMMELINVSPYLARKWIFVIDYKKVRSLMKKNKGILEADTSVFLIKVENYKDYKEFKELYPRCNDIYLNLIREKDIAFLLKGYNLSQKVINFVEKSYTRDPEKVFILKQKLDEGSDVETTKDVTNICGSSANSVQHFVNLLLADLPKTEKGFKRVVGNRLKVFHDLSESLGIRTTKNYVTTTVRDMLYIKELYLNGIIYDSVRNIPEVFDEKKLSKYGYYLKTITGEISYSKLLNLYVTLKYSGVWVKEQDGIEFIYNYYEDLYKPDIKIN